MAHGDGYPGNLQIEDAGAWRHTIVLDEADLEAWSGERWSRAADPDDLGEALLASIYRQLRPAVAFHRLHWLDRHPVSATEDDLIRGVRLFLEPEECVQLLIVRPPPDLLLPIREEGMEVLLDYCGQFGRVPDHPEDFEEMFLVDQARPHQRIRCGVPVLERAWVVDSIELRADRLREVRGW